MNILIIAPHPDDEVLGCGGSIARFADEGHDVYVSIITKAGPSLLSHEQVQAERNAAKKADRLLGAKETIFCDLPAANLDSVPHCEINKKILDLVRNISPDIMFIPFLGDIHLDHQNVFISSLVAARPTQTNYPKKIYAYETLSETNWNAPYLTPSFQPNLFIDISAYLDKKLESFSLHQGEVKQFPHERSLETLRALATLRGSTVHINAAEAFVIIREVI